MARKKYILPTLIVIFLALLVSLYMARHHYQISFGLQDTKSICNVSEKMDCDAVNTSPYSEILGIPVAMVSTFVLIAELLFLAGFALLDEQERYRPLRFLFYLSSLQLVASLGMAFISAFVLRIFCPWCSSLYVAAILIFVFSYWSLPPGAAFAMLPEDLASLFKPSSEGGARGLLAILALIPLGSWVGHLMYMSNLDINRLINESLATWSTAKTYDFDTSAAPKVGHGPIKIVEFFDFQCGHCRRASHPLHAFVKAHLNDVELSYQNFPLDSQCNPGIPHFGNGRSCELAKASLCANQQGKFTEAYFWIFEHQGQFDNETLTNLKNDLSLDVAKFDQCLGDPNILNEISKQAERGNMAKIAGTPAIFFQGRELPSGFMIPVLEATLKRAK